MRTFAHAVADPLGLHARSCVMLAREAAKWESSVTVRTAEGDADARSMSSLLSLKARRYDQLAVSVEGPDEADAARAIEALMRMSI